MIGQSENIDKKNKKSVLKIVIISCSIIVIASGLYYFNKKDKMWIFNLKGNHQSEQVTKCNNICGDVNCDGKVDGKDLDYLTKYLAKWDGYTLTKEGRINSDLNNDEEITTLDRKILSRRLANWNGYETLPYTKQ